MSELKADSITRKMTPKEFLDWQEHQELRHELVDGVPYLPPRMQAGTSLVHDKVTMNTILSLGNQLRRKPCRPCTSDVAIQIPAGNIRYPDVSIDCGSWENTDRTAQKPWLVFEVLSPSTRMMDSIHKLEEYKTVSSLRAIIIAETASPDIFLYTRQDAQDPWKISVFSGFEAILDLSAIDVKLPLSDIYEDVRFASLSEDG